ncbi:MAG: hypothetical protein GIW95_09995 [Candidatus Eremiobacteraeota bacterium]|nr:hypothetical protein [Candidatus Eremiobacteraeota bacterium]
MNARAALAAALFAASFFPSFASAAPLRLALSVDGLRGAVAAERTPERVYVPLAPFAKALGWSALPAKNVWELRGEGHVFVVRAGSKNVTDRGSIAVVLSQVPLDRPGALLVATDDLAELFGVRVTLKGSDLAVSTTVLDPAVAIAERPKPPARASPRPAPTQAPTPAPYGSYAADRVALTMMQSGAQRSFGLAITTAGTVGSSFAFGEQGLVQGGSVTIGVPLRHLTLGGTSEPLTGVVFHDAELVGTSLRIGAYEVTAGRRMRDARTTLAFAKSQGERTDFVELLRAPGGALDQIVAGRRIERVTSWGALREEFLAGPKGLAAGIYARTRGRLYGELTATTAGGGLPLGSGDAPLVGDGAYELSSATTVRGGVAAGRGMRAFPFVGLLERGAHVSGTLTVAAHSVSASTSYANAGNSTQFSISRASGTTAYALHASAPLRGSFLELAMSADEHGQSDLNLQLRLPRRGFDLFGGVEAARNDGKSSLAPLLGLALPLVHGLDLQGSVTPAGGKMALRVSIVAGIVPPHRNARIDMVPFSIRAETAGPESAARTTALDVAPTPTLARATACDRAAAAASGLPERTPASDAAARATSCDDSVSAVPQTTTSNVGARPNVSVYVDGIRAKPRSATDPRFDVVAGHHTVRIDADDGLSGSPDREIDTAKAREIALPLWPIRTLSGRIVLDGPPSLFPRDLNLAGVSVILDPAGVPASVDEAGNFAFPAVPVAPGSTLRVDETTLPPGVAAIGPATVTSQGDIVVHLGPARKVESVKF